jgi:hypothetical protein
MASTALWFITIAVALLIAAQLCWLMTAFLLQAALTVGVS